MLVFEAKNRDDDGDDAPSSGNCVWSLQCLHGPTRYFFSISSLAHFLFLPLSCVVYNLGQAALLNAEGAFPR